MFETISKVAPNLLSRYSLSVISISIITASILYKSNQLSGTESFFATFFFMALFHLITLGLKYIKDTFLDLIKPIKNYFRKRMKINTSIQNFDLLSERQKEILWSLYYHDNKKKLKTRDINVISLSNNLYIKQGQQDSANLESIYTLDKKVYKDIRKRRMKQLSNYIHNLTNEEKKILNMFCEKTDTAEYQHPWIERETYNAISKLAQKFIVERQNSFNLLRTLNESEESISLREDILNNKDFKERFNFKRKIITLDQSQIESLTISGSGTPHNDRIRGRI